MKTSKIIATLLLLCFVAFSYAQTTLTGTITNSRNKPVSKALIYIDTLNTGVKTNKKGFYSVDIPAGAKAINVYSYKYGLLSSDINEEQVINFVFLDTKSAKKDNIRRGDKVGIAYSETENKFVVHPLSVVDPKKEVDILSYNTIYDLIRGRVAGVTVTQNNRIRIRGVNSPNSSSEPLFVVDGTPVNTIDNILPINVKDIKILKGSETAIYGSRGANGVVVITTKS